MRSNLLSCGSGMKGISQQRRRALACAAIATAWGMFGGAGDSRADSLTWSGNGADQFFGTAGNWNPAQSPTSVDNVFFPALPIAPTMTPLWEAADAVNSISVDNSGGFVWQFPRNGGVNPRTVSIGSGGLTVTGGGTTTWGAISATIAAPQTWNIGTGTTFQFMPATALGASANKITKTGGGTVEFGNSAGTAFTGGWDITAGMLTNGSSTTNPYGTGATTVSGTGVLNLNITGAGNVSGGAITLANGGTLSGNTGALVTGDSGVPNIGPSIGVDTAASTSVIVKATQAGSNFRLNAGFTGGTSHTDSVIRVQGPGQVHLLNGNSTANAFLGTWKIESGGTLRAEATNSLGVRNGNTPSRLELNGGTMLWGGTTSGSTAVTFTNPILVTGDSTMSVDKIGAAGTVANNSGAVGRVLGSITIGGNSLTVNVTSKVTGGTTAGSPVRMGGGAVTLTGDATFNVVKPSTFDLTFAASSISDGGSGFGYTKSGTGWMSVSSASTYSGPTHVLGGTLFLNNTGALGTTSLLHVASGATANLVSGAWTSKADLSGGGTIVVPGTGLTAQGSAVSPGDSAGILSVTGNLALALDGAAKSSLNIEITGGGAVAGTDYDRLAVSGTLTGLANTDLFVDVSNLIGDLTGDVLTIVTSTSNFTGLSFSSVSFSNGASGQVHYNNGSITIDNVVVPEPAVASSMLLIGGMWVMRRHRRSGRAC
jgi:autotransporter-associated beta strand protein